MTQNGFKRADLEKEISSKTKSKSSLTSRTSDTVRPNHKQGKLLSSPKVRKA